MVGKNPKLSKRVPVQIENPKKLDAPIKSQEKIKKERIASKFSFSFIFLITLSFFFLALYEKRWDMLVVYSICFLWIIIYVFSIKRGYLENYSEKGKNLLFGIPFIVFAILQIVVLIILMNYSFYMISAPLYFSGALIFIFKTIPNVRSGRGSWVAFSP